MHYVVGEAVVIVYHQEHDGSFAKQVRGGERPSESAIIPRFNTILTHNMQIIGAPDMGSKFWPNRHYHTAKAV